MPAFDAVDPPRRDLIDDCVHCGFCLPSCPTYVLWGEEMDSPRGRIHLMKQGVEGAPLSDAMVQHFDACLGCLACVTACPSGVRYDRLIEATRSQVERQYPRPLRDRLFRALIFQLFPYPRRLRALRGPLRLYQRTGLSRLIARPLARVAPRLAAMESLAPPLGPMHRLPERVPAHGTRRATVGLLAGCVQSVFFSPVNAATARVLAAEGCEVVTGQGCCGALSLHVGRTEEARRFARGVVDTFTGVDYVVANVAGCGSSMKEYADLLHDDPAYAERAAELAAKTRDVSELLAELGPVAPRHPLPITVAYHDACHLSHGQGIRRQPRALLRGIPGLDLREIAESDICCGSAGVYNLLQPEPARELGERKARNVLATGAELLVTANPGCLMQIRAALERTGNRVALAHVVEVLDASIRGLPPSALA
ncbi:glycolate oxidase [Carbonactinospora thermoautotrophica]|uniref:Glycolate oxidase iron-sulfur subunit n=2 Tax=Carbonactinospora thermoautotrophica TaxID=1469144 RepID=A0A132MMJ6_9ACTN|nr:heterodisulfide reductase-related iron-sulfur binding cluster [Carbonactinospora thermoautotrophica]KWW97632.1 glycolate oxidase [Carbonactinospora thermoautotrophica]KWW99013.1 Glycolate dehydrogenase [Carbonactinospora thermoautotrophica]